MASSGHHLSNRTRPKATQIKKNRPGYSRRNLPLEMTNELGRSYFSVRVKSGRVVWLG